MNLPKIIWGALVVAAIVTLWTLHIKNDKEKVSFKNVQIGEVTLKVEVANTPLKQEKGLSGQTGLDPNNGMLFVFDKPGYQSFWMKDMLFPIDIAWLNTEKQLIYLESNVWPDSYPRTFTPSGPALYVLETSANFFTDHHISLGAQVEF